MIRTADSDSSESDSSEEAAFADYFAARLSATRRIAYLMCGDWHWADDLTQVAFVRLAAALAPGTGPGRAGRVRPYLPGPGVPGRHPALLAQAGAQRRRGDPV